MQTNRLPYARPRALAAELRRPQVFVGVAVWCGFLAVLLALSASA